MLAVVFGGRAHAESGRGHRESSTSRMVHAAEADETPARRRPPQPPPPYCCANAGPPPTQHGSPKRSGEGAARVGANRRPLSTVEPRWSGVPLRQEMRSCAERETYRRGIPQTNGKDRGNGRERRVGRMSVGGNESIAASVLGISNVRLQHPEPAGSRSGSVFEARYPRRCAARWPSASQVGGSEEHAGRLLDHVSRAHHQCTTVKICAQVSLDVRLSSKPNALAIGLIRDPAGFGSACAVALRVTVRCPARAGGGW
jgi:hypothetical protein